MIIHVIKKESDILNVSVSTNRVWAFRCDIKKHRLLEWKKTTLRDMFEYDKTVNELNWLSYKYSATRTSKKEEWRIPELEDDNEEE